MKHPHSFRRFCLSGIALFLYLILLTLLLFAASAGYILYNTPQPSAMPAAQIQVVDTETTTTATTIQTTTVATHATAETSILRTEVPEAKKPRVCQLEAEPILQNPELPTGCEVTALTMALQYLGYDVDKCELADGYLPQAEPYETTFGEAFIGSPYDPNAWGCYAPVIVQTAEDYIAAQDGTETVVNLTGDSMETLLSHVAGGTPVLTWVTIGMTANVEEKYWWTTPGGEDAVWLRNEHCVLLCGYDLEANSVTVCDPLEGKVEYDLDVFTDRYEIMYRQAVLIQPS